jgi:hypothetical protein
MFGLGGVYIGMVQAIGFPAGLPFRLDLGRIVWFDVGNISAPEDIYSIYIPAL